MSDELNPGTDPTPTGDPHPVELPDAEQAARPEPREGLPRGYRMRADRHYVDQLASAAGQPVRLLPITQIEPDESLPLTGLRPLIESIRSHGIVHPLLVRRKGSRFAVIAGRRRLAVAHVLRLATIPCIVHDVDDAQAAALAIADNLASGSAAPDAGRSALPAAIRQVVADHLATIRTCAEALSRGPSMSRSLFDLIKAHAWRAARLGDALDLISNVPPPPSRDRALSGIVDEIVEGFEPEGRLNDFTLRAHVRDDLSSSGLNAHEVLAGLSGALLASLPLVEQAVRPAVLVRASAGGSGSIIFEIVQTSAPVSAGLAAHFFDDEAAPLRPGGYPALAGALAAKALAERYAGTAAFEPVPNGGSTLRLVLARRS